MTQVSPACSLLHRPRPVLKSKQTMPAVKLASQSYVDISCAPWHTQSLQCPQARPEMYMGLRFLTQPDQTQYSRDQPQPQPKRQLKIFFILWRF